MASNFDHFWSLMSKAHPTIFKEPSNGGFAFCIHSILYSADFCDTIKIAPNHFNDALDKFLEGMALLRNMWYSEDLTESYTKSLQEAYVEQPQVSVPVTPNPPQLERKGGFSRRLRKIVVTNDRPLDPTEGYKVFLDGYGDARAAYDTFWSDTQKPLNSKYLDKEPTRKWEDVLPCDRAIWKARSLDIPFFKYRKLTGYQLFGISQIKAYEAIGYKFRMDETLNYAIPEQDSIIKRDFIHGRWMALDFITKRAWLSKPEWRLSQDYEDILAKDKELADIVELM